jgi:hypothetical protein
VKWGQYFRCIRSGTHRAPRYLQCMQIFLSHQLLSSSSSLATTSARRQTQQQLPRARATLLRARNGNSGCKILQYISNYARAPIEKMNPRGTICAKDAWVSDASRSKSLRRRAAHASTRACRGFMCAHATVRGLLSDRRPAYKYINIFFKKWFLSKHNHWTTLQKKEQRL